MEIFSKFIYKDFAGYELWRLICVFVTLLLALFFRRFLNYFLDNYAAKLAAKTAIKFDDYFLRAIRNPCGFLIPYCPQRQDRCTGLCAS